MTTALEKDNKINELLDHFMRHESGKMIAVLTGIFGSDNLMLAEDIVQDTIVEAISNWTYNGLPPNPVAWLYTVAKNKTRNTLIRKKYLQKYKTEKIKLNKSYSLSDQEDFDIFNEESIVDDQLRMMFMCCHPSISADSQIALMLKTLCGFNINEIAKAFMTNRESINKRLVRARKKIREHKISFDVPSKGQIQTRVEAVLEAIYLMFNEGYSASSGDEVIRVDLCKDSIRLCNILAVHQSIDYKSEVYALLALMLLNTSRFDARRDANYNIITLDKQDRALWDLHTMELGFSNLRKASRGGMISKYHLLATISSYHCAAKTFDDTDWLSIKILYDKLVDIDPSPMVILNRAIVLSQVGKTAEALNDLDIIESHKMIQNNYLYFSVKSDLHLQVGNLEVAKKLLQQAILTAPLQAEKRMLRQRLEKI